jgi:hypothetical protein
MCSQVIRQRRIRSLLRSIRAGLRKRKGCFAYGECRYGQMCRVLVGCVVLALAVVPDSLGWSGGRLGAARERGGGVDYRTPHASIIGGAPAEGVMFGSLAFVRDVRGQVVGECTGTVVAPNAVLTAAHCVEEPLSGDLNSTTGYAVATGSLFLAAPTTQISGVTRVVVDPAFRSRRGTGDAAILILSELTTAPAVGLQDSWSERAGPRGIIAGWGLISFETNGAAGRLYAAKTTVQSSRWCDKHVGGLLGFHSKSELCVSDTPQDRTGSCAGDSGGPLLVNWRHVPFEIGIISHGSPTCSTRRPTVLTSIHSIYPWLRRVLDNVDDMS